MNTALKDKFLDMDRFGFGQMAFKINGDKNERKDIPECHKRRQNNRSAGIPYYLHDKPSKCCGSLNRRVWNNECYDCYKVSKDK